jgi:DNA-binding NarL/FixJ family response regulator
MCIVSADEWVIEMVELLLVEDSAVFATTLERFLRIQKDLHVVAVAPSAEVACTLLQEITVDLILVDVSLPGSSGIDLVEGLHGKNPGMKCLMLSGHQGADYVQRALAAGAAGYALKSDPLGILTAIRQVLAGESYISPGLE